MRLAVVDQTWNWPARGGADVDLFHVCAGLHAAGVQVRVFFADFAGVIDQGSVAVDALPFPATRIEIPRRVQHPRAVGNRIRAGVAEFRPDAVMVASGFHLKPHVLGALAGWPRIARYYAYEAICPRNLMHWLDGAPCPANQLHTPERCRACALAGLREDIRAQRPLAWPREYLAARAWRPDYAATVRRALGEVDCAIVSNTLMREQIRDHCRRVEVFPGGFDPSAFHASPPAPRGLRDTKVIFMPGRAEDPLKGLDVLLCAGARLYLHRQDFQVWATAPETTPGPEWFRALGGHSRAEMQQRYAASDIVVVPSVWEEPFGLVAVEAMACGRPVCASDTGGLAQIVADRKTGFLFPPGDDAELAVQLGLLLDNPALRGEMGAAGRARVEAEFAWDTIIARDYLPLLAQLAPGAPA